MASVSCLSFVAVPLRLLVSRLLCLELDLWDILILLQVCLTVGKFFVPFLKMPVGALILFLLLAQTFVIFLSRFQGNWWGEVEDLALITLSRHGVSHSEVCTSSLAVWICCVALSSQKLAEKKQSLHSGWCFTSSQPSFPWAASVGCLWLCETGVQDWHWCQLHQTLSLAY